MHHGRLRLVMMLCAGIIATGAVVTRSIIARQLAQQGEDDLREIVDHWRNAPPPPLPEIATLSPYEVNSEFSVMEVGGPERANSTFALDEMGLEIQVSIHTCRPRLLNGSGEINLVDGSREDLCTSGGAMIIFDTERGEEFLIHFKLIGTPNGTLSWNARQLVSRRGQGPIWRDTLVKLRSELPRIELSQLPPTVQESHGVVESYAAVPPHALLISGDEEAMRRLLQFRMAFREFYENPESPQAQQVARLLIDSLLESPQQQELSKKWVEELGEAG